MRYFDSLGVKYTYKNIDLDSSDAQAAIEKSGQTGIPVIDMDGDIVVGFDRPKINQLLKDKKLV